MSNREYDIIIVGAGILGSALAASLSQYYKILLIERDMREPDRIVGELLQPGGVQALRKLGLDTCLDEIDAVRVDGYQCIYHGESVTIPYSSMSEDRQGNGSYNGKWEGRSFHHGRFVQQLRRAAQGKENVTTVEATVSKMIETEIGHIIGCKTNTGEHYFAPLTVICDGCFSKFRSNYIEKKPLTRSNFVALLLEDADMPAPNHGHVILSDISPILVYQISTNDTRMLIDIQGPLPSNSSGALKTYLTEVVLPQVPIKLKPSVEAALNSGQRIRSMPNSFLPPTMNKLDGAIMVGDAMNMRHPLTGGGMTVALKDVVLLNELLAPSRCDITKSGQVKVAMEEFHWARKGRGSSTINVLAQALYSLFALPQASNDADHKIIEHKASDLRVLQEGCFRYFQLGGSCVSGPVGFLSGITPSPVMLFLHFFAVAVYAIYLMLKKNTHSIFKGGRVLWTACLVLFPVLWSEIQ